MKKKTTIINRLRSAVIRATAALLNLNSEICCYADPEHPVGWRDRLRWWIEDRLSSVFALAWPGSDEELLAVDNDEVPAEYMSERQRAYAASLRSRLCPVDDDGEEDLTCPHCGGSGGEPLDDGCTLCEYCDGEGYLYWM